MKQLAEFVANNEHWIKSRINSSTKDVYLQDEIYSKFLMELTEVYVKNNRDNFIAYAKILGVNAPTWSFPKSKAADNIVQYEHSLNEDWTPPELVFDPNDYIDENFEHKQTVNKLLADLNKNKAFGMIKILKMKLRHPEKDSTEIGKLLNQKRDSILQQMSNLRKMIKDGKIKVNKRAF